MLKRLLKTIANRNVNREDIEAYRKYVLIILFFCVGIIFLFAMGILAFIQKDTLLGITDFVVALLLALFVYLMWKRRKFDLYCNILIIIAGLFCLFLFIIGGVENTAHVWCYAFPVVAPFIVSYKRGLIYSSVLVILLAASQLFAHLSNSTFIHQLSINYLIRFFTVYAIITFVSCIAEWARTIAFAKLDKYYDGMQNTIRELEYTRARLRELTNIDPLTEIYNKRYLTKSTKVMVESGGAKYVVSMFFDIDDFKKYNDYYGHIEGDKVLVRVVEIIKRQVRSCGGIFARFGGEELVYLMKTNDIGRVEAIAQRILADFEKNRIEHAKSKMGYITVSIGIAHCLKKDFTAWKPVVIQSDAAMYQAKRNGKNTYYIA